MTTKTVTNDQPIILIADDDVSMRLMVTSAMEQEGYNILEAEDGETCLQMFEANQPDLVLLDAMMPGLDGFATCTRLQRLPNGSRTPVLMITGLADGDSVNEAFKSGATDYITKPIHWDVLRQRVRRLLQARRAEDLRDELVEMIVHDMKNPITVINGYSEILTEELRNSPSPILKDAANRVFRNSGVLLDMTMMILDLQKLEEGGLALNLSTMAVAEVLKQVADELGWVAEKYCVAIRTECPNPRLVATLDWDLMKRVLVNLVTNALKRSPKDGTVTVSGRYITSTSSMGQTIQRLTLAVRDEGEGIAAQDQGRIFDKYLQAGSRKGRVSDTGLGLTFCKLAVEAHGGSIQLESEIGVGSTFSLVLPLLKEE